MNRSNMEENGLVLDFLPQGMASGVKKEPVAQVLGDAHFTLLEVVPKPDVSLSPGEKIFIGKGDRDKIDHIRGRVSYNDLTGAAKNELPEIVNMVIHEREKDFVGFFNKCGPVTIRLHQLELLPGVGKKHMQEMLAERDRRPFESFDDLRERVKLLPDPARLLKERILEELQGGSKYYILTRPPQRPRPEGGYRQRQYRHSY